MNTTDTAKQYIRDIQSGRILACEYVKQAVNRHVNDLKTASERGLYFDEKSAAKALKFFNFIKHSKGSSAGKAFILEPWQSFIVYVVYGWKKSDGFRRFNEAYVEVAKKNGKTTLLSGLANLALVFDGEAGAEVYAAAFTRDQASICFDEAVAMVKNSPDLSKRIKVLAYNMSVPATRSKFQAVSNEANNTEGKNAHFVSFDEYHVHKNNKVKESLKSGQAARDQPLFFIITTAGDDPSGPCFKYRKECAQILEGVIERDNVFCIIYTLDISDKEGEGDDWKDPSVWIKANPNLDKSVKSDFIRSEINSAITSVSTDKENEVKTKHLNLWVGSAKTWIKPATWNALPVIPTDLSQKKCYGGLDLASVSDFAAYALLFELEENQFALKVWLFLPRRMYQERIDSGFSDLEKWARDGHIVVTDARTTDYNVIKEVILNSCEEYDVQFIGFDRWNSSQLVNDLLEELGTRQAENDGKMQEFDRMNPYGQGYRDMSPATKGMEKIIEDGHLSHEHNPALAWMLSNMSLDRDPAGNVKPNKASSSEKIDGIVASLIAVGEQLTWASKTPVEQEYKRGDMYA